MKVKSNVRAGDIGPTIGANHSQTVARRAR
jgi:hypothetical protein